MKVKVHLGKKSAVCGVLTQNKKSSSHHNVLMKVLKTLWPLEQKHFVVNLFDLLSASCHV